MACTARVVNYSDVVMRVYFERAVHILRVTRIRCVLSVPLANILGWDQLVSVLYRRKLIEFEISGEWAS